MAQTVNDLKTKLRAKNTIFTLMKLRTNLLILHSLNNFINERMGVKINLINIVNNLAENMAIEKFTKSDIKIRQEFGRMWESVMSGESVAVFLSNEVNREKFGIPEDKYMYFRRVIKSVGIFEYFDDGSVYLNGEMIFKTAGLSITLAEVLSADNVAFVDPMYIDKNFKNNRDKFLAHVDIYRVLQNMMSNLPIRELNRIPRFTEEGRFRPFGNVAFESNPLLDVRVTDDPSLSRLLHNGQMRKSDLMKLYIWVKSLKRFLEGATQTSGDNVYIFYEDMSDADLILYYRARGTESERTIENQQFQDGTLEIFDHSQIKILQKKYDLSLPETDPNHPRVYESECLLTRTYSLMTGVVSHAKIGKSIRSLDTGLTSHITLSTKYGIIMKALNNIYKYNPDLANNLATLYVVSDLLTVEDGAVGHWKIHSIGTGQTSESIFPFKTDQRIKNRLIAMINNVKELSGASVYMSPENVNLTHLTIGHQHMVAFMHIMDAVLHSTIPGTFEGGYIFMPYNRITTLFEIEDSTIMTVQENDLFENFLKKLINGQGFSIFEENFESFRRMIVSKTVGRDALWTGGDMQGFIWRLTATSLVSPLVLLREKYLAGDMSVMEWEFINDARGPELFIGALAGDLKISFPQLGFTGAETELRGDSEFELRKQLAFQFYRDSEGNFVQASPGEFIRNKNGDIIGVPRFLSLKNQFVITLSQDTFNTDTVIHLTDIRLGSHIQPFADKERSFIYGLHGTKNDMASGYSDTKVRKIKEGQDDGTPFISGIKDATVYSEFEASIVDIRTNRANPLYDPDFATFYLMADLMTKVVHIWNNPALYDLGIEEIIDKIAKKAWDQENRPDEDNGYYGVIGEECIIIAKAFGKVYIGGGEVIIQSLDSEGNILLDSHGAPLMLQCWERYRNSHLRVWPNGFINIWYEHQLQILEDRLHPISKFYHQIDPIYYPNWVLDNDLSDQWDDKYEEIV